MDTSNMKNIVVLKDLPSNIVEEAIVFLKPNQKIRNLELVKKQTYEEKSNIKEKNKNTKDEKSKTKNYAVKEAEMVIADYITKIENQKENSNKKNKNLQKKYNRLKKIVIGVSMLFVSTLLLLLLK
ncbi:MAG: hypothetical protein ACLU8F_03610 [Clostridia bacterium]